MPQASERRLLRAPPSPERVRLLLERAGVSKGSRGAFVSPVAGSREAARRALGPTGSEAVFVGDARAFAGHLVKGPLREWVPSGLLTPYAERRSLLGEAVVDVERRARERAGLELRALLKRPYSGGRDGHDLLLGAFEHGKLTGEHPEDFVPTAFPALKKVRGVLDTLQDTYENLKRPGLDEADLLLRARDALKQRPEAREAVREAYPVVVVDSVEELLPAEADLLAALDPERLLVGAQEATRLSWHPGEPALDRWTDLPETREPALDRAPYAVTVARTLVPGLDVEEKSSRQALPPRSVPAASEAMQARLVAVAVTELLKKRTPPGEIAIVHRGRTAPAPLLEAFRKADLPHTLLDAAGGDPHAPEVPFLAAYLRWMADERFRYERHNPEHRGLLETLLRAHEGVTAEAAGRFTKGLADAGRGAAAADALERALKAADSPAVEAAWVHLRDHRVDLRRRLSNLRPADRAREAARFLTQAPARPGWDLAYLERLAQLAREVDDVTAFAEALHRSTRGEAVRVLPAAETKGRSFRHVFLVGAARGEWPRPVPEHVPDEETERWNDREARLFALGVLAATERLTASATGPTSPLVEAFTRAPASMRGAPPRR